MINQLSAFDTSIKNKPVPVWSWPQYASVGVRDKSFSNIDPSLAYAHNTTTPGTPYGTSLAYDSSGTVKVVSSSNPLPVTATITSTALSGIKFNLEEISGTTVDSNSGNKSAGTLRVTLATDQVQLTNALKVDGSAVTQPVSGTVTATVASTSLAGLQVDQRKVNGVSINVGTGAAGTGTPRVAVASDSSIILAAGSASIGILGANSGVDIGDVTINNSTGGSAVNIQDGGNTITVDGTVTVTLASTSISGLEVNQTEIKGVAVSVGNGTTDTGTQRVTISSDSTGAVAVTNVGTFAVQDSTAQASLSVLDDWDETNRAAVNTISGQVGVQGGAGASTALTQRVALATDANAVNVTTVTTSAFAGIKVQTKNDSTPIVTTTVVGIAAALSGDNILIGAQGAGKKIYVYSWNISFAGTVNAKFSDSTSKLLAGLFYGVVNAGGGASVSPNFLLSTPQPYLFETQANSRLYLNLSGATAVGGSVSFFVK